MGLVGPSYPALKTVLALLWSGRQLEQRYIGMNWLDYIVMTQFYVGQFSL